MMIFYFNLLSIFVLGRTTVTTSFTKGETTYEKEYQYCVCVPYWQCKEDYSGLVEDGVDIIDVRLRTKNGCTGDFDVCCQIECGKSRTQILDSLSKIISSDKSMHHSRITEESNEAGFAEFPWMLGIIENMVYRCGASLIHPQIALTAAHCVSKKGVFQVRAGEWNWAEVTETLPHQDRKVKKVIQHPSYHPTSLRNDIALLILDSPFKLSENVGLACLPLQNRQFVHKKCIVTGWGKSSYKNRLYEPILQKMEVTITSLWSCVKSLQIARLGPFFNLHESFICAGNQTNIDTCKGDGGSPLVCNIDGHPGRYEQVGIVSWGLTCKVFNTPVVYVNVALFREWIDNIMELLEFDTMYSY